MERSHLKGVEPAASNGTDSARLRPTNGAAANGRADSSPIAAEALLDLEKIRDILFGAERRESDRRFADLESRLEAQAVQSELEIQRRMEAFEEQIKEEVRNLGTEITTAQQVSADRLDKLAAELRSAMDDMTSRVEELSTRTLSAEQELRDQLAQQSASLSNSLRHNYEELSASLDRNAQELRAESVNWAGLGTMLGDLANQVSAKRPR